MRNGGLFSNLIAVSFVQTKLRYFCIVVWTISVLPSLGCATVVHRDKNSRWSSLSWSPACSEVVSRLSLLPVYIFGLIFLIVYLNRNYEKQHFMIMMITLRMIYNLMWTKTPWCSLEFSCRLKFRLSSTSAYTHMFRANWAIAWEHAVH